MSEVLLILIISTHSALLRVGAECKAWPFQNSTLMLFVSGVEM